MTKKEQLLTLLPETIPEKSLCSLESSSYTPNPKPNLLVPLYQNHSDCFECKLSAMWINSQIFFFFPFETHQQTWPDLTKPVGIPRTKVKLVVNRGWAGVSSGTPLGFELRNIFYYFCEISGFTLSYTSEPLSFGYFLDHFNNINFTSLTGDYPRSCPLLLEIWSPH
jgi:hypothetical protein